MVARGLVGLAPPEPGTFVLVALQLSVGLALAAAAVGAFGVAGATTTRQLVAFVLCFGVFLPAALIGGGYLGAALAARHSDSALSASAGLVTAGILVVVLTARLVDALGGAGDPVLIGGAAAWALAVTALSRATGAAAPLARAKEGIWIATATLTVLSVAALMPARLLRPGPLALSLLLTGVLLLVVARSPRSRAPRRLARALDAGALALILLTVVDVSVYLQYLPYDPYSVGRHLTLSSPNVLLFAQLAHQDFYLGPINDVLHGRPMLVHTYSQYGTGIFYFLAAWFKLAPLGYGPLGLLAGALTALQYACAYAILRVAGCRQALAIVAITAAIVATLLGAVGSVAQFPSTGGLRYLWAYLLILVAVAGARWPAYAGRARAAQLLILGVSAAWSLEAMAYGLVTFAAVRAVEVVMAHGSPGARWRQLLLDLAWGAACCVAANLLLALGTLAFAGEWPDWRPYLAFFGVYSGGDVGFIRQPLVRSWSTGFGLGALYFATALGVVAMVVRRPQLGRERRPALVALTGCTVFGIVALTYWVGNSQPNTLRPIALPAIMVASLWLALAGNPRSGLARPARVGALALGLWTAVQMVAFAAPEAERKWHQTALYHAFPGTPGLRDDLRRVWRSPRIDPRSAEAEALLARHMPGHRPVLVLTEPDLAVETLVRSHRSNALPIGDLLEDDLIRTHVSPRVNRAIDGLRPGALMLTQLHPDPRIVPLSATPLQQAIMARFRRRFELQAVETSPSGLSIVRLEPRVSRPPPRSGR